MKYRELLELYKKGQISKEKIKEIEKDIEKYEAIEEYLYEKDNKIDEICAEDEKLNKEVSVEEEKISEEINKSIKIAFKKMGVTITIAVVVILLIIGTVLPKASNVFWYNPAKEIDDDIFGEKISRDIGIFTDVFMPNNLYTYGYANAEGYGKYKITIGKNIYDEGKSQVIAGEIKRNKMIMYAPDIFEGPIGNAFAWRYYGTLDKNKTLSQQKNKIKMDEIIYEEEIKNLDENKGYRAYISFNEMMDYKKAYAFADKYVKDSEVWLAIDCGDGEGFYDNNLTNIGMTLGFAGFVTYNDDSIDPMLDGVTKDKIDKRKNMADEKLAEEHFTSMLKYLKEQKSFRKTLASYGRIPEDYDDNLEVAIKYIDKNGIKVYGMSIYADKEQLEKLASNKEIFDIKIEK